MAPRKKRVERRKPGSGRIRYKKGRALPYEAAYPLGHDQYRYDYFATREEAAAHLDRLVEDARDKDTPRDITSGSQRVDVFLTIWLNIKQPHLKSKTFLDYKYQCELAVEEIGAYRVDAVSGVVVDSLLLYYYRRGYKNVGQMKMVLRQAFQYAVKKLKCIKENPFEDATVPSVERREPIALTERQRGALLAAAITEDRMRTDPEVIPLCPLWHLYSRLAFRKGEGIALRRRDIDFEQGTITIAEQYTNVGSRTEKSTPKGDKKRTIAAPQDILDLLQVLLDAQVKRAAADPHWQISDLVFVGAHGAPLSVWYVQNRWRKLRGRAGLPQEATIHSLRHTALYRMEQSGVPQSVRMAFAGHSTAAMAGHYTDHAREDLEAMRRFVNRA
jgi:integrase